MVDRKFPDKPIFLVDDEKDFLVMAKLLLKKNGLNNVITCSSAEDAIERVEREMFSVVVLDVIMPGHMGDELLRKLVTSQPGTPAIMVTAVSETEKVVECMKIGAYDYITKPIDRIRFITTLQNALSKAMNNNELESLKEAFFNGEIKNHQAFESIITNDSGMQKIFSYMEATSKSPQPILITGETGVGKELFAKAMHILSGRLGEFVAVNLAGLDNNMFSDTLFGHSKGAYTGAHGIRKGLIEQASGGTLFLDEIGDLNFDNQIKLLRLLQEKSYYPVGSDTLKLTNARVIAATNKDIVSLKKEDSFRSDLYYRLRTHELKIPPLRKRKGDIPFLVRKFVNDSNHAMGKDVVRIPKELFTLLNTYHFPGNVRELEGMVYDAVSITQSDILSLLSFKEKINDGVKYEKEEKEIFAAGSKDSVRFRNDEILPSFKEVEIELIKEALLRTRGNVSQAADLLGITRQALNNRINRNNIQRPST